MPQSREPITGRVVREIREMHRMTRKELGEHLGVAAVTIEKWEQSPDKPIRPKYFAALSKVAGAGIGAGAVGLVAAPAALAALPVAGLAGLAYLSARKFWTDGELDEIEEILSALRRLTPEERATWIKLSQKMATEEATIT